MNRALLPTLAATLPLLLAPAAQAEGGHEQMDHAHMNHGTAADSEAIEAEGKINAIDLEALKVNIAHGPIQALRWPPMVMDLALKEAAVAEGIQVGDTVRFELERTGVTDYVIVKMEKR